MTKHATVRRLWLPAFACLLVMPAIAAAQVPSGPSLHDGVVVSGGSAYVMSPSGGIEAIDLASGASRWRSDAAAKPLAVSGGTLVAQAAPGEGEQLVLVCLETGGGAARTRSRVSLPGDLKAEVANTANQETTVRALLSGSDVVVAWAIDTRLARGLAEGDNGLEAVGATRLNPATGEVVAAEGSESSAALSGLTLDQMSELRSVDGQHVMRSTPSPDPANIRAPYRWTITTAAGETVGVVDAPVGLAPFIVQGSLLVHVAPTGGYREGDRFIRTPLRLRAIDARSGAELWTVPVFDAAFVLPPP
jgi:hypothetical protein